MIDNSTDNVNDIISLANDELERKSKSISNLQSRLDFLEAKNIEIMNEEQLNLLKDFYTSKLGSVLSAINNFNKEK